MDGPFDDYEEFLEAEDEGDLIPLIDEAKDCIRGGDFDVHSYLPYGDISVPLPFLMLFVKLRTIRLGEGPLDWFLQAFETDEDKAAVRSLFEAADKLGEPKGSIFLPLSGTRSLYLLLIERVKPGEDAKENLAGVES